MNVGHVKSPRLIRFQGIKKVSVKGEDIFIKAEAHMKSCHKELLINLVASHSKATKALLKIHEYSPALKEFNMKA